MIHALDQQRQRFVTRARLDVIHAIHRAQVERIGRQPVKRVRRHTQHFARTNLFRGILYQ